MMFRFLSLFFLRASDIPGVGWISVFFYWLLSKDSVLLFLRETFPGVGYKSACLSTLTSVPKLKILFQISLTEKWHFGTKGLCANHLTFSFSHYSIQSRYLSNLDSFLCPTDYRSWSVGSFDLCSPAVLTVSPNACWFKYSRVRELTSPSLSHSIPCHNIYIYIYIYISWQHFLF